MAKRLINEKELAEYSGFKVQTLQKWRLFGKGPIFFKIGASVRYDLSDVERWLESCRTAERQAGDVVDARA